MAARAAYELASFWTRQ